MARQSANSKARSALVITDARTARQFGAHGAVVLWRDGADARGRRGLLCIPRACDNPECFAIHVWLGEVADWMTSVSMKGHSFEFALDAARALPGEPVPASEAHANYDTRDGSLTGVHGSENSPLVQWLVASADIDVLAHLRTPLLQRELAAGRITRSRSAE